MGMRWSNISEKSTQVRKKESNKCATRCQYEDKNSSLKSAMKGFNKLSEVKRFYPFNWTSPRKKRVKWKIDFRSESSNKNVRQSRNLRKLRNKKQRTSRNKMLRRRRKTSLQRA